jgi:hypothetical protein
VKYWLHEIMLHRPDLSDWPSSGRRPLEDTDARILQVLEADPWSSVRTIAEFLKIPASMVHLYLTTSLNMKADISNGFFIFLMMIREQNDWRVPTASRCPAGTREMPFSRSNYRRWDIAFSWHEVRDSLASGWRRTTSPCQKDNYKRKAHADRFLGNPGDGTLLLAPER